MTKIIACYVAFHAADAIERSLNSIIDLVDFVVSVDGVYVGTPAAHHFSDDETQDIVKQVAWKKCRIIFPPNPLSEPQTRNLYTRLVVDQFPNEWLFRIDSDEVLHDAQKDFAWLRSRDARRYNITYVRRGDKESYRRRITTEGGRCAMLSVWSHGICEDAGSVINEECL